MIQKPEFKVVITALLSVAIYIITAGIIGYGNFVASIPGLLLLPIVIATGLKIRQILVN
jgi:hypothetical protein